VARAGHSVMIYSKEVSDRTGLKEAGAQICGTAIEAVAGAELVCLCVFDQAQAREATLGANGILPHIPPGAVLAIHSTCSASAVVEIAEAAGPSICVLDAPFSGFEPGQLTLLVGGASAALEAVRPVFAANAREIFLVGGIGAGQRTKLVNQFLFRANIAAADSALRLLESGGGDRRALVPALMECSGASFALSTFTQGQSIEAANETFAPYLAVYSAAAKEDGLEIEQLYRRGEPDH
jgi:3-hydroxyisobutyrate dehydrogenase